jgi:hypothetical protein
VRDDDRQGRAVGRRQGGEGDGGVRGFVSITVLDYYVLLSSWLARLI